MLKLKKLLVLGGSGLIGIEVVRDLITTSEFEEIIIADGNIKKVEEAIKEFDDKRVKLVEIDVEDTGSLVSLMKKCDLVSSCLPFKYDTYINQCCVAAGVTGTDLGATSDQLMMHDLLVQKGLLFVVCDGISPGTSNMIAAYANQKLDHLDEVHIGFASFRALQTAPGLVRTTLWEIDPKETGRSYLEDGKVYYVEPFSGEKIINFPEPIGPQPAYYVPHNEVYTIPRTIPTVKSCSVRGAWTKKTRRFLQFLYDYGFYTTEALDFDGKKIPPMDFIEKFVFTNEDLKHEDVWGFSLTVDCKGIKDGEEVELSFYTTTPSQEEWGIPAVYAKSTALSLSVGTQLLARGIDSTGIRTPDEVYDPEEYINELVKRGIVLHERNGMFGFPK